MIKAALTIIPILALGACASTVGTYGGDLAKANEQLGFAVRQNIAAQTVNPGGSTQPVVAGGARAALAVGAYQADQVESPGTASTMSMKANAGTEGGN